MKVLITGYFLQQARKLKKKFPHKGKSGGLRSYIYLYRQKNLIVPVCIYFKSEQESITERALDFHFKKTLEEIITKISQ